MGRLPIQRGRVRRLLRAVGLDPDDPAWAAFARTLGAIEDPARIRRAVLSELAATGRQTSRTGVARIERVAAGLPVPELVLEESLGLPLEELLGAHELVTRLVARTLRRCASRDLGRPLTREELARWTAAVARAASPEDLREAQWRWVLHRAPGRLVHFCRVWPEGADLGPMRRAYLRLLEQARPGFDGASSVVGHVEITVNGDGEDRRRLVDWTRSTAARLVLACGEQIEVERGVGTERSCFSVADLGDRSHSTWAENLGAAVDQAVWFPPPSLELWDAPCRSALAFPAVDRLLRILARAALGRANVDRVLPALAATRGDLGVVLEEGGAILGESFPVVAPVAGTSAAFSQAVALATGEAADHPAVAAAWTRLREGGSEARRAECWVTLLHALALWRWTTGFAAIAAEAGRQGRYSFHDLLRRWVCDRGPWGFRPRHRVRKPRGLVGLDGVIYDRFHLDPEGSPTDSALVRVSLAHQPPWGATWLVNQWPAASELVGRLLRRSGAVTGGGGLVRAHFVATGDAPGRSYSAFKVRLSEAGRAIWCLDELSEWVLTSQPRGEALRSWRDRNAARVGLLPTSPWPTSLCWPAEERDLGWIGERLWRAGHFDRRGRNSA